MGRLKGFALFVSPLTYFVLGMLLLAGSTIFYPAIADTVGWTRADMAAKGISEANYWGMAAVLNSVRFIVFIVGVFVIVIGVVVWWIKRK